MKKVLSILACIGLIIWSCSKDDSSSSNSFDRELLTNSLADNLVDEYFVSFQTELSSFQTLVNALAISPSEQEFNNLQDNWKTLSVKWQGLKFFIVKDLKYTTKEHEIAYWPILPEKIDLTLTSTTPLSNSDIASMGSNQKGIFTLEYLLFNFSWSDFSSNPRIIEYVSHISENNKIAFEELFTEWTSSYKGKYKGSLDNFVTSSIPITTNRLIEYAEFTKNEKLGYPLALSKYKTMDKFKLESIYAKYSLELISANITTIKSVYLGHLNEDRIGYDDFLISYGKQGVELDKKIKTQISLLENKLMTLSSPIFNNIPSNTINYIEFHTQLKALIKLLKVELLTILDITPTFSDGDGD